MVLPTSTNFVACAAATASTSRSSRKKEKTDTVLLCSVAECKQVWRCLLPAFDIAASANRIRLHCRPLNEKVTLSPLPYPTLSQTVRSKRAGSFQIPDSSTSTALHGNTWSTTPIQRRKSWAMACRQREGMSKPNSHAALEKTSVQAETDCGLDSCRSRSRRS